MTFIYTGTGKISALGKGKTEMGTIAEPFVLRGKAVTKDDCGTFMPDITIGHEESVKTETVPGEDIEVESWHREAVKLLDFAGSRKIENMRDMELAADDLTVIGRLKRAMAEKQQLYTGPLDEKVNAIKETFRELMAPAEEAEKITRKKMSECRAEQERSQLQQSDLHTEARVEGDNDAENQGQ
jgi:hypothetical protein